MFVLVFICQTPVDSFSWNLLNDVNDNIDDTDDKIKTNCNGV